MNPFRLTHSLGLLTRSALAVMLLMGLVLAGGVPAVQAVGHAIFDGSPGTGAPPATLGPYGMMPFGPDARPVFDDVSTIPGPTGDLALSANANHRMIGSGWSTWSHGYAGSVYYVDGTEVTITLPAGTYAFYLYVESNSFGTHPFTVVADGTSSGQVMVLGDAGATYFGF
jgi:hypothetical protein